MFFKDKAKARKELGVKYTVLASQYFMWLQQQDPNPADKPIMEGDDGCRIMYMKNNQHYIEIQAA